MGPGDRKLKAALDALVDQTDPAARRAADPVAFPRRYTRPADIELVACVAALLAFGRVSAFWPVIEALVERLGPDPAGQAREIAPDFASGLYYRWLRAPELGLLVATLGEVQRLHGRIGALFEAPAEAHLPMADRNMAARIEAATAELRRVASGLCVDRGETATLSRGFRYLIPAPSGGSGCKRWCMLTRWMARPDDGVDLGLWAIPTRELVLPVDTHVLRIAQLVGLTARKDASWRTATEITARLARLCQSDPTRYDFALAHLGISGRCTWSPVQGTPPPHETCLRCALAPVCVSSRQGR